MLRNCITLFVIATVAFAADRRQSYEDLAASSDKIVLGSVGVKRSHWGDDSRIYTDVVISPDVTIKGSEADSTVVVQMLGGTVGDTTMTVSDGPEFPDGERVVVFLKREADHFVVSGRSRGSIRVLSADAAEALDGAFSQVERKSGKRLSNKRGLAESYVDRALASGRTGTPAAAQVGCYSTDGAKWGTSSATYKIGASIPADWNAAINASAATWNGAGAAFQLVNDQNSVNELSYADLVARYGSSYTNTYAVTTTWSSNTTRRISKATIEINNKWPWLTTGAADGPDVQGILTHEFGHWMRLLDIYSPSTCSDVTMWGTAPYGETKKRTLEQADIDGFLSLYNGTSTTTVGTPTLTSPANGATNVATTPTLTWSAATNAMSYDVYFGTAASPALVTNTAGTSYQPGNLTNGTTYYWRVVAKNSSGTASSNTASFTVGTVAPASGPTLLSPANGATGQPLVIPMSWTAVSGATGYYLYVGTTTNPGRIGSVSGTSVTVRGFQSGVTYYWKVVARTASGQLSSAVWSFRTN